MSQRWTSLVRVAVACSAVFLAVAAGIPAEVAAANTAAPSATLSLKSPDAADIATALADRGEVRVLVQFASTVTGRVAPDPDAIAAAKATIDAGIDAILVDHFGTATALPAGASLLRMLIRPIFAITVSPADLYGLVDDPRITRIWLDRVARPALDDTVPLVGMTDAYTLGGTGSDYAIAILDTGFQLNHEFLASGKIILQHCFSENSSGDFMTKSLCPNGDPEDTSADSIITECYDGSINLCAHGTVVAGVAAGFNTNRGSDEPANGVARDAKIIAVQIFARVYSTGICDGAPSCILTSYSREMAALEWVYSQAASLPGGVQLAAVNLSIGSDYGTSTSVCDSSVDSTTIALKADMDNLRAIGVPTVVSTGNDYSKDRISYPACISSAVAVAASTKDDHVAAYTNIASPVALLAPGGYDAYSTSDTKNVHSPYPSSTSVTDYEYIAGTSLAAAHVSGAFAALRSACGSDITADATGVGQMLTALESTGVSITDDRFGGSVTKPRIQVDDAINSLCPSSTPAPTCTLTATPSTTTVGVAVEIDWTSTDATSGSVDNGVGSVTPVSGGWQLWSSSTPGTFTFTGSFSGDGGSTTCQTTVTVNPASNPAPTCSLSAPSSALTGVPFAVSWTSTNATSGSINNGVGDVTPVASGSTSVALSPAGFYSFEGTFSGPGGTVHCGADVIVGDANAPACTLSVDKHKINVGEEVTLSWTSTNATSGVIRFDPQVISPTGDIHADPVAAGSQVVLSENEDIFRQHSAIGTFTGPNGVTYCSETWSVALDPLTLLGLTGLAGMGLGARLRRRKAA